MEIVPGKSAETLRRATDLADAERLESSPLPDMSELMTKVNNFGDQLNILTTNLNDIVGDLQFRKALKSMAVNLDNVSYQANLILQRSQGVVDNIELASQNVSTLSAVLKDSVEKATADVVGITASAKATIDNINTGVADAKNLIGNIDAGVTDARKAVNATIGNPDVAKNLTGAIANINSVTGLLAERNDATEQLIDNLSALSGDLKAVSAHVRAITGDIDPASVSKTINSLNAAIASMTGMVEKVKSEPVLALSINKAADRIVKMKFDEMAKQQIRTSDNTLKEINRWIRENMNQGYFTDPAYSYEVRPYALPEAESAPSGGSAVERQPYIQER
jgi:ABC-type transporter Mla subunit MlaD